MSSGKLIRLLGLSAIVSGSLVNLPSPVLGANEGESVAFPGYSASAPIVRAQLYRRSVGETATAAATTTGPALASPAVVSLHGCSGTRRPDGERYARDIDWTERLLAAGYVVLAPDSFASRELGPQCAVADRRVFPRHRADDVAAAADWLAGQVYVDKSRIAVIGWSHGGSSVLHAVRTGFAPRTTDFKTAIAFYPGCRVLAAQADWASRLPLAILMGGADDWTPPEPCRAIATRTNVRYIEYADAFHGFDAPGVAMRLLTGLAYTADGSGKAHIGTHPAAREKAIAEVLETLRLALR